MYSASLPSIATIEGIKFLRRIGMRALILLSVLCVACSKQSHHPIVELPLPKIDSQPLELRVAHVVNPRLPSMTDAQIRQMLEIMAQASSEHFGISIRFTTPVEIPIAKAFENIPPKFMAIAKRDQYDFQSFFSRPSGLAKAFGEGLAVQGESLEDMALFAQKKGVKLNTKNFEAFGEDVAKLQLSRITEWSQLKASDGQSVIDDQPFHHYTAWNKIGYGQMPFELVITNQIIASVEYITPSIHTAIRGGFTNGITHYNALSRFGSSSIWSTFAFTQNDPGWIARREGEAYTPEEAARLAGLAATHEIGHQLLHLIHPFGQKGCIMEPVPMFAYRAWVNNLSAKDCPLNSSPAMKPGAYTFRYIQP
jgi:hypothetical protein